MRRRKPAPVSQQDRYDRILGSLHEAALDDAGWPETAALIDAACGIKGNVLVFGDGDANDVQVHFARFCFRGQRREDWEREYFRDYWFRDERVPRLRRLPDSLLVHATELYTEAERKTSAAYNEALPRSETRDSLNVRLEGPDGTRVVWTLADPVDGGGWRWDRTRMIERLLPHVRQFVRVRMALAEAGALGQSLTGLLDATRAGVIHLDRRGQVAAANDTAVELLRRRDGLIDDSGALHAVEPADDDALQRLLGHALPLFSGHGVGGSMTVGRTSVSPRLVLHVSPVGGPSADFRMRRVAALVLVVDPGRRPRIDPDLVAAALGLTSAQSSVAAMLAAGYSLGEIAAATSRTEGTTRWHLKQIFTKLPISRQADLVRLVLSASTAGPVSRH